MSERIISISTDSIVFDKHNNFKLISFGSSCRKDCSSHLSFPVMETNDLSSTSPEILFSHHVDFPCDIWSAGIVLYAMVTAKLPFKNSNNNPSSLSNSNINDEPSYLVKFSFFLTDLLKKLLTKKPEQRISIEGILNHPWLSQVNFPVPNFFFSNSLYSDSSYEQDLDFELDTEINSNADQVSFLYNNPQENTLKRMKLEKDVCEELKKYGYFLDSESLSSLFSQKNRRAEQVLFRILKRSKEIEKSHILRERAKSFISPHQGLKSIEIPTIPSISHSHSQNIPHPLMNPKL